MTRFDAAITEEAPEIASVLPKGRRIRGRWRRRLLTFLIVFGPGLIVMEADNDAGAVATYTQAGAQYGFHLLWFLFLCLPVLYFIQEMVVRLGIATGRGHVSMIFQRFGKWWGIFSLSDLLIVNALTLVTEFAGISLAFGSLGVTPYLAVPVAAVALIILVATGSYLRWERVTIGLCLLDAVWFATAALTHPGAGAVARGTFVPQLPAGGLSGSLLFLMIAIVGTTIAPWQLFFQQSAIADKHLRFKDLTHSRLDTLFGAVFTILVGMGMMIAGAATLRYGISFGDPAQIATDLGPHLGAFVRLSIPLMFVNAAVLGTTAVSLASAWAWGEARGRPSSLQLQVREAPVFYSVYALGVLLAAGVVLIPHAPLQLIIISVQVLAGIILPVAIIFLQLLLNDKELLGEQFVNKAWNNWINWSIITVLFGMSLLLAVQVIFPSIFPS